jgi:hypothetical protein
MRSGKILRGAAAAGFADAVAVTVVDDGQTSLLHQVIFEVIGIAERGGRGGIAVDVVIR